MLPGLVHVPVDVNTCISEKPPAAVEAIVIAPEPFVTDIPVPAVSVAFVKVLPVVLPINNSPSVYEPCPVPPSATAKSVIPCNRSASDSY
jgi:hypothetical protein